MITKVTIDHTRDITDFRRGKKLVIHSDKPAAVNVDGETKYVTDTAFELVEKGITFVVPAKSAFLKERGLIG